MKRRLLNFLTVMSLLLCVPVIASWWPSLTYRSHLPDPYAWLGTAAMFLAAAVAWFGLDLRRRRLLGAVLGYLPSVVGLGWITVMWARKTGIDSWLPAIQMTTGPALTAILLGHVARARVRAALDRRRRRDGANPCTSCGYDLSATLDRCPECGHVPRAEPAR